MARNHINKMQNYIGRFAPSPTGPLHIGSLIAALASYLDARANGGLWRLRIDDIDATRCKAIYAEEIKTCLQNFGLHWDGDATNQQSRADAQGVYEAALNRLAAGNRIYACVCSRKEIADSAVSLNAFVHSNNPRTMAEDAQNTGISVYSGVCRTLNHALNNPHAGLRLRVGETEVTFDDRIQASQTEKLNVTCGDFILKRKDGLFAYQLAVVVDDHIEAITHIVRGADLLDSTPRQIYLQRLLGFSTPQYAHLPVALTSSGEKLSKQTCAPALPLNPNHAYSTATLIRCLKFLDQAVDGMTNYTTPAALLAHATNTWNPKAILPQKGKIWVN